MMRPDHNGTRRDAVRLLLCTLSALALIVGAAAVTFAPFRPGNGDSARLPELSDSVRVNVNKADIHALSCLAGVGPIRAQAIIAYREQYGPYLYLTDLCYVEGIDMLTVIGWGNMAYTKDAEGF